MHRSTLTLVLVATLALLAALAGSSGASTSADRQWTIGFSSDRFSRDAEIYSMRADGSGVRRLTRSPFFDGFPKWSPDRKKIAFYSGRGSQGRRLAHERRTGAGRGT